MTSDAFERGFVLYEAKQYSEALKQFGQSVVDDPHNDSAFAHMALCQFQLGNLTQAEKEARQALNVQADSPFNHYVLSYVLSHDKKRMTEALKHAETAVSLNPYNPDYFSNLSFVHLQLCDWKAALKDAQDGLGLNPEHDLCLVNQGWAFMEMAQYAQAEESLLHALRVDPNAVGAHGALGWLYFRKNNFNQAMRHFKTALRADPTSDWAREGLVAALRARNPWYAALAEAYYMMGTADTRNPLNYTLFFQAMVANWLAQMLLLTATKTIEPIVPHILNFYFRFDPYADGILFPEERKAAEIMGAWYIAAYLITLVLFIFAKMSSFFAPVFFFLYFMPFSAARWLESTGETEKKLILIYCSVVFALGIGAIALSFGGSSGLASTTKAFAPQEYSWILMMAFLALSLLARFLPPKRRKVW